VLPSSSSLSSISFLLSAGCKFNLDLDGDNEGHLTFFDIDLIHIHSHRILYSAGLSNPLFG
jgi:hypothetical protein